MTTKYILITAAPAADAWRLYQPGEALQTASGRVRFFRTPEAAAQYRRQNLPACWRVKGASHEQAAKV